MKNMIFTVMLLAFAILFAGCDKAKAQEAAKNTKNQSKNPTPEAVLIIDEVAYVDGCNNCDCVEEGVCACETKADCACCRKNMKKAPAEMQKKCKEMKKTQAKTTACCDDSKKDGKETACCDDSKKDGKDTACNDDSQKDEKTEAKNRK